MATTLRQAVFEKIKSFSDVLALLSGGSSAVLLSGRVGSSSPALVVALEMGMERGRVSSLPFTEAEFNVYAYQRCESASSADFTVIDTLLNTIRDNLHGASLTISGVGRVVLQCAWDNFRSPDRFDERRRAAYRSDRYRVWMVLTKHYTDD